MPTGPGYHLTDIKRGELGLSSKIVEELNEFLDSEKQGVKIMALLELSDMIGAIEAWLKINFHDSVTIMDLWQMSNVTQRAFKNGHR